MRTVGFPTHSLFHVISLPLLQCKILTFSSNSFKIKGSFLPKALFFLKDTQLLLGQITHQPIIFLSLSEHFTKYFLPSLSLPLLSTPTFIPNFSNSMILGHKGWEEIVTSLSQRSKRQNILRVDLQGLLLVLLLEGIELN